MQAAPYLIGWTVPSNGKGGLGRPKVHIDVEKVRRLQEEKDLSLQDLLKISVIWNGRQLIPPSLGTLLRRLRDYDAEQKVTQAVRVGGRADAALSPSVLDG